MAFKVVRLLFWHYVSKEINKAKLIELAFCCQLAKMAKLIKQSVIQQPSQGNQKLNFLDNTMGACLIVTNREGTTNQEGLASTSDTLRAKITQQLKCQPGSHEQQIPSEFSNGPQLSFRSNRSNRPENISEKSCKFSNSSKCSLQVQKINEQSCKGEASIKSMPMSLRQSTGRSRLSKQSQEDYSEEEDEICSEDIKIQLSSQIPETPENWKHSEGHQSMIGLGLNQDDNAKIKSTLVISEVTTLQQVKFKNLSSYTGQWLQGKKHGQGKLIWNNGSIYTGQWINNFAEGYGQLLFTDGGRYEGQFVKNKAEGQGVFTYADGSQYNGMWQEDLPHGRGILVWEEDEKYEGDWVAGKKSGEGKITFRDGSYYKGDFHQNEIHGKGYYCWKNEKQYFGDWEHNQMSGKGKMTWIDGDVYEGQFYQGKQQGDGVLMKPDGSKSKGSWLNGRKHGVFTEIDSKGTTTQMEWYIGKKSKPLIDIYSRLTPRKTTSESKTNSSMTQQL